MSQIHGCVFSTQEGPCTQWIFPLEYLKIRYLGTICFRQLLSSCWYRVQWIIFGCGSWFRVAEGKGNPLTSHHPFIGVGTDLQHCSCWWNIGRWDVPVGVGTLASVFNCMNLGEKPFRNFFSVFLVYLCLFSSWCNTATNWKGSCVQVTIERQRY